MKHRDSVLLILLLTLFLYAGCSSSNNTNSEDNFCYLLDSTNPCFDPNQGGSTSTIILQTLEDVVSDLQSKEGFQMTFPINNIITTTIRPFGTNPDISLCPLEQSELVIKTTRDWQRFRNSCLYSGLDLQDVDFENNMILVSNFAFGQFVTRIKEVLEFESKISVVIEDSVSLIPTPAAGFPINIVSVPRSDLQVDFIRLKKDITPTIVSTCLDASDDSNIIEDSIECPTDALLQICNTFQCNNLDFYLSPVMCAASSCFDVSCFVAELDDTFSPLGEGDFNIENVAGNNISGVVTIEFFGGGAENISYQCSPIIN